jgi:hypothetical protein
VVWPGAHWPVQAPVMHVWLLQATAELHAPLDEHVSTPLPEHWVALGTQTPVHPPPTHAELLHAAGLPHAPAVEQVSTPLPEHVVAFGVHTPWDARLVVARCGVLPGSGAAAGLRLLAAALDLSRRADALARSAGARLVHAGGARVLPGAGAAAGLGLLAAALDRAGRA